MHTKVRWKFHHILECGHETAMRNAYINHQTNSKKLQFGAEKCKKIHVGHIKEDHKCQDVKVEHWTELEMKNDITGEIEIKDTFAGELNMEDKDEEKYLGDVISNDGKNIKNIKARIAKGKGIVTKILTMLEGISFGQHYFEVGILLRDSLLVSSILFNAEALYNFVQHRIGPVGDNRCITVEAASEGTPRNTHRNALP